MTWRQRRKQDLHHMEEARYHTKQDNVWLPWYRKMTVVRTWMLYVFLAWATGDLILTLVR